VRNATEVAKGLAASRLRATYKATDKADEQVRPEP
jgi:hypothetical protein